MPNRATVVQSSFWRVWLQGRLAPFPAPNRISITYLMVKKIEQGHTGAPGSLNFLTSICIYIYIYNIYIYICICIYIFHKTYTRRGKKIQPVIFLYKEFFYSAWTVLPILGTFRPRRRMSKAEARRPLRKGRSPRRAAESPGGGSQRALDPGGDGRPKMLAIVGVCWGWNTPKTIIFFDVICDFGGGKNAYTRILSKWHSYFLLGKW